MCQWGVAVTGCHVALYISVFSLYLWRWTSHHGYSTIACFTLQLITDLAQVSRQLCSVSCDNRKAALSFHEIGDSSTRHCCVYVVCLFVFLKTIETQPHPIHVSWVSRSECIGRFSTHNNSKGSLTMKKIIIGSGNGLVPTSYYLNQC